MKVTGPTLLQILFIALKLLDKIDWSWLWVLAPTWIPVGIGTICLAIYGILLLFESKEAKARRQARELLDRYAKQLR